MKKVMLLAHRGFSGKYPENSPLAFHKAVEETSADGFESDVHITKDGKLIIFHDATVERTSNGTGFIKDHTYEEMLQLDIGSWKSPEFAGQHIWTFDQLLDFCDETNMLLNMELKNYEVFYEGLEQRVIDAISPDKDVDGFTPVNVGRMVIGEECFLPCTPAGCIEMLKSTGVPIAGKDAVVIGRSNIVGKPAALLLTANNATVTLCHSKTRDLKAKCAAADIIVAAIGKAGFVTADMVKEGAVVIDVGINRNAEGKLCGDVDFAPVAEKAAYITPVPGGVGLMTRAMLMKNTVKAARLQSGL